MDPLPNHLISEKSPYLQQHVHNPVDWYPWGGEAFRRAAEENKPVFVSIGYATCHWCHVMARESFEDPEVANLLNANFIAVKVDREERPDIDSIYLAVCQQMTGQGGWPLTVILTPDKKPFFAGTYFPKSSRAGMIGLIDLLVRVSVHWKEKRDDLEVFADQVTTSLLSAARHSPAGIADKELLDAGFHELEARFDAKNGGFGAAPKFPTPSTILFLLRFWKRTGSSPALHMAKVTLDAMRKGGIHDHLGGGFHRYSTDPHWRVPHFEKMLYDQALLLMAYTEAFLATKNTEYRKTAEEIITYVLRDLSSPEGAFISAEDADSGDGEGAFYIWDQEEFDRLLGSRDGEIAARHFGQSHGPNFVIPETGRTGNVLFLDTYSHGIPDPDMWEKICHKLFTARAMRSRPGRDDKILTDWNALFVTALAKASVAFDQPLYLDAAEKAMHFIQSALKAPGGEFFHRYCAGEAAIPAFADDYAFLIQAQIALYEASFDSVWLESATDLNHYLENHFWDTSQGGFFTLSDGADPLIVRKKELYDGAIPSCNSIMLQNLVHLGHLTGNPACLEKAAELAKSFAGIVKQSPSAYAAYLAGLDLLLGPATVIVIVGNESDPCTEKMITSVQQKFLPSATVLFRPPKPAASALDFLAPFTRDMDSHKGKATAYICHGTTCSEPVCSVNEMDMIL